MKVNPKYTSEEIQVLIDFYEEKRKNIRAEFERLLLEKLVEIETRLQELRLQDAQNDFSTPVLNGHRLTNSDITVDNENRLVGWRAKIDHVLQLHDRPLSSREIFDILKENDEIVRSKPESAFKSITSVLAQETKDETGRYTKKKREGKPGFIFSLNK